MNVLRRRCLSTKSRHQHYDYLVIGAGSGGMASARRAADLHGKKVGIIERGPLGGTCVNVGCVPKKIMWTAAELGKSMSLARDYGYNKNVDATAAPADSFNWSHLKTVRDAYLLRLNGIYQRNLDNSKVDIHYGSARFVANTNSDAAATVQVVGIDSDSNTMVTADHILIATGGYPVVPDVPGASNSKNSIGVTSDGFFELEEQPKRVAVVGAGYIAVELAGVMAGLGSEVSVYIRGENVLRSFDDMVSTTITSELESAPGVTIHRGTNLKQVERSKDTKKVTVITTNKEGQQQIDEGYDEIVYAIGRAPAVNGK